MCYNLTGVWNWFSLCAVKQCNRFRVKVWLLSFCRWRFPPSPFICGGFHSSHEPISSIYLWRTGSTKIFSLPVQQRKIYQLFKHGIVKAFIQWRHHCFSWYCNIDVYLLSCIAEIYYRFLRYKTVPPGFTPANDSKHTPLRERSSGQSGPPLKLLACWPLR